MASGRGPWRLLMGTAAVLSMVLQSASEKSPGAYFLPEFALSPQGSFLEDTTGEQFLTYRYDDQTSRSADSEEDRDGNWDAWGGWSDCSRTCGGGASYSLRRCLTGRNCEGQNIRYKTCSNQDCPADADDFRAQQCSAYNDVQYQGHYYEWLPQYNDPVAPCALKCHTRGQSLVVELAPKVLDGTRCNTDSLDMCISGVCQAVGCDRQLGSQAKEDNCGACAGDGSTCRLVRGQAKSHVSPEKREENVIAVPLGSRSVRITVRGPAHLFIESKTLQGSKGEHSFSSPGVFTVENTTVEFQKGAERQSFRVAGPLMADFIFKTRYTVAKDSTVQFFFYQPISHQWRQTDFFPCTVTCGGGYQLNSAECVDVRLRRVVPDHYCHYYPENVKPKPKLRECAMDPCPSSDGFKEIMPYDHFQPLPRWEHNPWTACSVSCGGGTQRRSFVCVEESLHAEVLQVEEWKCMYAPKPKVMQTCNLFDCPKWVAMDWSECTVTCGRGLRYRVVLCINHRGQHVGGCNPQLKLHIKEECVVPVPCYKPKERNPVEATLPWLKQAQEREEMRIATEDPTFVPGPWSPCSATCGPGVQVREVKCRVLLTFTQAEAELPEEECEGPRLPAQRPCLLQACGPGPAGPALDLALRDGETMYGWEYAGFTPCTATCLGGHQEAIAVCLHTQTQQAVNDSLCDQTHRPPVMSQACNTEPCPPRWHVEAWGPCSATCGVGIQTREVQCLYPETSPAPPEDCSGEKPHALQACNQFDCPPRWYIEEWQQCSRTCGGGTQTRRVACRQLLTDGSFLSLSDKLCQGPKVSTRKSCARTDCPPHLEAGDWSKCSVSCGVGIQRRRQVCQKLTARGLQVPLGEAACHGLTGPPLMRACQMRVCGEMKQETKPRLRSQGPEILSVRRVYIQTREEKRINLTVGSRAYLLPNTSVIIKCPVRRFQKSLIQWEKDGLRLRDSRQVRISRSGSLKIHCLTATDVGVYRCVAGPARETVALQLICTDSRLVAPREHARERSRVGHGEANSLGPTWHKMWQVWSHKDELYPPDGQIKHQPLLRALLGRCGCGSAGSRGSEGSSDAWGLEDKRLNTAVQQGAYSMDAAQFEELRRNMSQLLETGEVSEDLASQVIYQLAAELARAQRAAEQGRRREEEPSATTDVWQAGSGPQSFTRPRSGRLTFRPRGPILRRTQPSAVSFNKTITAQMGNTVYITNMTQAITLLCGLPVPTDATYMWTKDGVPLQPSARIVIDGAEKIQIRNPTRTEQGLYECFVAARLGSGVERSPVLWAEAPVISSAKNNVTKPEQSDLSTVVGSTVEAALGADLTLQCPVRGVPQPTVTWLKRGGPLGDGVSLLLNGSLLLQNISLEHEGTYVCTAANALGEATAAMELHLLEGRWPSSHVVFPKGHQKEIPLAATHRPNSSDPTGLPPQEPFWESGPWTPCSTSCGPSGARVQRPRCVGATGQAVSEALCAHLQKPRPRFRPCDARDCPARWFTSAWSECSVPCGQGFHSRQVTCKRKRANGTVEVVPPQACGSKVRPPGRRPCSLRPCGQQLPRLESQCPARCMGRAGGTQRRHVMCGPHSSSGPDCDARKRPPWRGNCTVGACDACWRPGPWKPCTAACGRGFQSRKVHCVHAKTCQPVAEGHCVQTRRPPSWRHCLGPTCDRDCTDTTQYCSFVKQLHLCSLDLYKQSCCRSCQDG